MAIVKFTAALKRFFPDLQPIAVKAGTVGEALAALESTYPGLRHYLLEDTGRLRQHVNIFRQGVLIQDRETLSDALGDSDEVHIIQALSGG
jgi:sulfur-carrier protein